jgi:hypothetical protein
MDKAWYHFVYNRWRCCGITGMGGVFPGKRHHRSSLERQQNSLIVPGCDFSLPAKNVLQLLSAIPFFSELAFTSRNFIIAYLHLVLIGFISLFIFAAILQNTSRSYSRLMYRGIVLFVFGFISSELVLIGQAAGYFHTLRLFQPLLFGLRSFFPLGLVVMYIAHQKQNAGGIADEKVKPNLVTAA